jgi:hypothetical protein
MPLTSDTFSAATSGGQHKPLSRPICYRGHNTGQLHMLCSRDGRGICDFGRHEYPAAWDNEWLNGACHRTVAAFSWLANKIGVE